MSTRYILLQQHLLMFLSSFVHVSTSNSLKRKGRKLFTDDFCIKGTAERLLENSLSVKFEK